jgi:hypothetical protein
LAQAIGFTIGAPDVARLHVTELLHPAVYVGVRTTALPGTEIEHRELAVLGVTGRARHQIGGFAHRVRWGHALERGRIDPGDV